MADKNIGVNQAPEQGSRELKDAELEKVSGGFNPQPDPPGDRSFEPN